MVWLCGNNHPINPWASLLCQFKYLRRRFYLGWPKVSAIQPGMIYVDTSTVSPALSARVATRAAEAGVPYVRCTVSGNPVTAKVAVPRT